MLDQLTVPCSIHTKSSHQYSSVIIQVVFSLSPPL